MHRDRHTHRWDQQPACSQLSITTGIGLQVASPWFYLLWSTPVILLPVVARWAFGECKYAAWRDLPILATRLLALHFTSLLDLERGLFVSAAWPDYWFRLFYATLATAQIWVSICYRLPLGLHIMAAILTAMEYVSLRVPSVCRSPPTSHLSCRLAANQTEAAFGAALAMADGKYQAFADVLDWPFAQWVHAPLEARFKVSDAALCAVVLAWSHVAFAGVGSTMVVLAFQRWQAPATGRRDQLELGGGMAGRRAVSRGFWRPITLSDGVMYTLCGLQCLWCVLRVVYIKLL